MSVQSVSISKDDSVNSYILSNSEGSLSVHISQYGARVTHVFVQDRSGKLVDVAMGFDTHDQLLESISEIDDPYIGAIVGRVAGSIFPCDSVKLNGLEYSLNSNKANGASHHGGLVGFDKRIWNAKIINQNPPTVEFSYLSKHGEEGYPGNLLVSVIYSVSNNNEINIKYEAHLVQDGEHDVDETIMNITNHTYFNLSGFKETTIRDHFLKIYSEKYLGVSQNLVHNGTLLHVNDSPLDFTVARKIGERIDEFDKSSLRGYDHVYVIQPTKNNNLDSEYPIKKAAKVWCESTGICLEILSDEPGLVLYTGNWISPKLEGKGTKYQNYCAFALESQRFNNSINIPEWKEQVLLKKDQKYSQNTTFRFSLV
ncbi:hypothetical protein BB559_004424 [Furculomyces boomerangus]|uniref:Aldose 1-epimerase n=1 Tax=Furculomyces boomerangus TaxID=61424 RepID=A0A2T9YEQ2_9FUNG|nr:hypothetical protein BB559_004424 [Furculomyces boomerangus]